MITQDSDPELWTILNNFGTDWVVYGDKTYRRQMLTSGAYAFQEKTTLVLLDSRSIKGRSATYKNLEE